MSIEVMRQALEALELAHPRFGIATEKHKQAITALRAAIEQAEKQDYIKLEAAYFSGSADGKEVVEQYDQTALELCKECGWRAMIPGDGCLVCARQNAKPVAWEAVYETIIHWDEGGGKRSRRELARRIVALYTAPPAVTQKPVAYADERIHGWPDCFVMEPDPPHTVPLYTAPRQWVGLTFDELPDHEFGNRDFILGARWAEAKLKEKNAA